MPNFINSTTNNVKMILIVGHHDNCGLNIQYISIPITIAFYLTELNPISLVKYQSQGKKRVAINSDSQDIEEVHMTEALGPNISQSEFQYQDSITGKFSS